MTRKIGPEMAPYDNNGNLMEWTRCDPGETDDRYDAPAEWRPNEPQTMTLEIVGTERGRSAARFVWRRVDTDATFPMFLTDAYELMLFGKIVCGRCAARWIVRKRGQNYGIALDLR